MPRKIVLEMTEGLLSSTSDYISETSLKLVKGDTLFVDDSLLAGTSELE